MLLKLWLFSNRKHISTAPHSIQNIFSQISRRYTQRNISSPFLGNICKSFPIPIDRSSTLKVRIWNRRRSAGNLLTAFIGWFAPQRTAISKSILKFHYYSWKKIYINGDAALCTTRYRTDIWICVSEILHQVKYSQMLIVRDEMMATLFTNTHIRCGR